jgi:hypothetical protein
MTTPEIYWPPPAKKPCNTLFLIQDTNNCTIRHKIRLMLANGGDLYPLVKFTTDQKKLQPAADQPKRLRRLNRS